MSVLAAALMGCPKPAVTLEGAGEASSAPPAPTEQRTEVTGPTTWEHSTGLCLDVPAGWSGWTADPPQLLELAHAEGPRFTVLAPGPAWTPPLDDRHPGHRVFFDDEDSYRNVPLLKGGGAYTLTAVDAGGDLIQGWYAEVGGRRLVAEVRLPFGHAIEGRATVTPLLEGLRGATACAAVHPR